MGNSVKRREMLENSSIIRKGISPLDLTNSMLEDDSPPTVEYVNVTDPNAIVPQGNGDMVYKRFLMTTTGLQMPNDTTPEEWQDVGNIIKSLETSLSWIVGDWALFANEVWGWTAAQIAEMFNYEQSTIETYTSVCRSIPGMIRNHTVSFGHHRAVMGLSQDKQVELLQLAAQNNMTVSKLKAVVQGKPPTPPTDQLAGLKTNVEKMRQKTAKMKAPQRRELIAVLEDWLEELRTG